VPASFIDLPCLRAGEIGTVLEVDASPAARKRLADMGFIRGAQLEMLRPGSPCIVRIDGACVGLGNGHQKRIRLRLP